MTGCLDLSSELLTYIFKHCENQNVLAQVSLVCRVFYSLATPVLYQTFRQEPYDFERPHRRLFAFFRTVLARPDFACYVQQVIIHRLGSSDEFCLPSSPAFRDAFYKRVDAICFQLSPSVDWVLHAWTRSCEIGFSEAILTALLCSLPNLKTLTFRNDRINPVTFFYTLAHAGYRSRAVANDDNEAEAIPFLQMHSVRVLYNDSEHDDFTFMGLCHLFSLPAIRNIEISGASAGWINDNGEQDECDQLFDWSVRPRSSSVQKLSFQESALDHLSIATIVRSCACLKQFYFTRRGFELVQDFRPMVLLQALLAHRETLEILHIDYGGVASAALWLDEHADKLQFGDTLQELSRLRKLHVSFSTFFGVGVKTGEYEYDSWEDDDSIVERPAAAEQLFTSSNSMLHGELPPSLEELAVIHCDARVLTFLQDIATSRRRGLVPGLSSIICVFNQDCQIPYDVVNLEIRNVHIGYIYEGDYRSRLGVSNLFNDKMLENADATSDLETQLEQE